MLRPYDIVRILRRHHATLSPPGRAAFVQDDVDRQAMQPRAECALSPERRQPVPEPHEDILGALFGVAPVAGEPETERVDTAGVLAIQLPKSGLVPGLGSGDEIVRWGHSTKTPCGAAAFGPGLAHAGGRAGRPGSSRAARCSPSRSAPDRACSRRRILAPRDSRATRAKTAAASRRRCGHG